MTPAFEKVQKLLRQLPGLGFRSSERIALYLLLERPKVLKSLVEALESAATSIQACEICGNITEESQCTICKNPERDSTRLCIVEQVPDLIAIEKTTLFTGTYHILQGKISPLRNVGPEDLNITNLENRIRNNSLQEIILALSNDMEGEATCYYLKETLFKDLNIPITRIGFGLPSGGGVVYADSETLRNALNSRRVL